MKKKPDLIDPKFNGFRFPVALLAVLIMANTAINWKSYTKSYDQIVGEMLEDDTEDIPLTQIVPPTPPPPPPPPPEPVEIIVVDDEEEIAETVIADTETDQEEIIEDVEVIEEDFVDEGPKVLQFVKYKPMFPGTTDSSFNKFQSDMHDHIKRNFRYPAIALELGIKGTVFVEFTIDTEGNVEVVRVKSPDRNLEREAVRIINKIPKLTPARNNENEFGYAKPVKVKFTQRIKFTIS